MRSSVKMERSKVGETNQHQQRKEEKEKKKEKRKKKLNKKFWGREPEGRSGRRKSENKGRVRNKSEKRK